MGVAKRIGLGVVGLLALAAAIFAGLILADRLSRPPTPDPAALIARGQTYHARVRRDDFGVPHVSGPTDADVAFGLAYAHAEDDFATIQDVVLATRGTLAAEKGPGAAAGDYLVRLLRVREDVHARYRRDLPADVRRVLEAYADGLNLYAARHPKAVAEDLTPVTGEDIAAGFAFKTPLFYGLDETLKALLAPTHGRPMAPIGSNGAAVAPSRSADGATRLLVNSHQPLTGPVAWYEAVLESGEGWHVAGGFFPGSPFMLHGHNEHLGWAHTVNAPDLVDIYRLTINPRDGGEYRLDGRWRRFETSDAAIRVRLFGPLVVTVHKAVLWSAHGPVLKTDHGVFAIRYAGIGEIRQVLEYYRMDKARTLADWRAALALQALPSLNCIYADQAGNIGYVYNGLFPDRKPGFDWRGVLPGDRSDLIWTRYLPFDRVPQIWNPKSGYVFNANNTPFRATGPEDQLRPADFPAWMGIQTDMTNRALRFEETLGAQPKVGDSDFRHDKFDIAYSPRSEVARAAALAAAADAKGDADIAAGQALIRSWDLRMNMGNRASALAIAVADPIARAWARHRPTPDPVALIKTAEADLKRHFHEIDPPWGQVNRIIRGKVDLPIDGGPDTLRAVYGETQKDGRLKDVAGDTLVMFVTWDRQGRVSSESIHPFGSATLDAASRHYADQTRLFAAMGTKPVRFTDAELAGHVERDYDPSRGP